MPANAKGVAFRSFVEIVPLVCGPGVLEQVIARLPPELAKQTKSSSWLTSGWYPLADLQTLHRTTAQVVGRGPDLAHDIAFSATRAQFRGIYKTLTFVLSPAFIIRRAPAIFSRFYDFGALTVTVERPGQGQLHFRGCTGFDRYLWSDTIGGTTGILEVCGGKNIHSQVLRGGGDGDDEMVVQFQWT